jgi:hypothetical protein
LPPQAASSMAEASGARWIMRIEVPLVAGGRGRSIASG